MEKGRILIVEDESIVALEIEDSLNRMGYHVCGHVNSGADAIGMVVGTNPDLILMDINLIGEMDGIEAAEIIRQQHDVPVIYLTAYYDEETTGRAKVTEPLGYINKPFEQDDLRIALELAFYTLGLEKERKAAINRLRASEKRFEDMFNSMIDGYAIHEMIFDAHGNPSDYRFISVNPAFETYTGLKADDITGRTVLEVLPEIEKSWIETYGKVVQTGESVHFQEYSGEIGKYFDVSAYRVGKNMFAAAFVDITDRRRAEEKLERESRVNASLAESARLLLSASKNIHSFAEVILELSRSLTESRYGMTVIVNSETREKEIISIPPIREDSGLKAFLEKSVSHIKISSPQSENQNDRVRATFCNSDAGSVSFSGSEEKVPVSNYLSVPVFLDKQLSGQIILFNSEHGYREEDLLAVEQIGELFAMAIQGHRLEAERMVMQDQMKQMQKMEVIGTLAGGIAHDFNNILQPIMGYAAMTLRGIDPSENTFKYVSSILTASERARDLVQQILTFARKTEQEMQPVEMQIVTKEVVKLLRSSIPSTIQIKQNISRDCGLVMADPTKIHQIVMNLATNAYHAMQETGGVMHVRLKMEQLGLEDMTDENMAPGDFLCLTVSDTGTGIDPSIMDKIFDPYFTTKAHTKGTGLGLSVVMGIVKSYGGMIQVQSEPGSGTEFKLYLPVINEDPLRTRPDIEAPVVITGTETVLLVDDESAIIDMQKNMLEEMGYSVTTRNSAVEALELFKRQGDKFDLIITDMTMPNMTGAEMSRKLLEINPELPIIICTGFSELINEEKAASIGIRKMLLKPVSQVQLGSAIREVLDVRQ